MNGIVHLVGFRLPGKALEFACHDGELSLFGEPEALELARKLRDSGAEDVFVLARTLSQVTRYLIERQVSRQ